MNYREESLKKHYEWQGKIETKLRVSVDTVEQLSLAYTPGVAEPCMAIHADVSKGYDLTRRWNTVAVVTDGSAVLGLGNIGPEAGMPVMEGKCVLLKAFGGVDAFPICIKSNDVEDIIKTVQLISGSFGGINLEDISAPRCFEIERRLRETCDIPVFHDDQHGTAIVSGAALLNAVKVTKKDISKVKVVINGAGSAGIAICKFYMELGVKNVIMVDRFGIICEGMELTNPAHIEISKKTNREHMQGNLADAIKGADVFVGVSVGNIVSKEMIRSMNRDPIVFPLANPVPEITRELAIEAGAKVVGTGASTSPNQINNVLIFPGIFRGALDSRATDINEAMKIAACRALAALVDEKDLNADYVIPSPFDKRVAKEIALAVADAARKSGIARK